MSKVNDVLISRPTACTPDSGTGSSNSLTGSVTSLTGDRFSPFQCNATNNEPSTDQTVVIGCCDIIPVFDTDDPKSRKTSESSYYEDNPICEEHGLSKDYFCYTCIWEVCVECVKREHNEHYLYPGLSCRELFEESEKVRNLVKDNMSVIERQITGLHYRKMATIGAVQQFFNKLHDLINSRERQLLSTVNYISDCRARILDQRLKEHQSAVFNSVQTTNALLDSLKNGSSDYVLQTSRCAKRNLELLRRAQRNFQFYDEDIIFIPPDEGIVNAIKDIGSISGPSNYSPPVVSVPAVSSNGAISNITSCNTSSSGSINAIGGLYNASNGYDSMLGSFRSFSPFAATGNLQQLSPFLSNQQQYQQQISNVSCSGAAIGSGAITVTAANGLVLGGQDCFPSCEFPVSFHTDRNYSRIKKPVTVFGTEGSGDGELCRPWGVCCDANGQVIVADRSNNRIQIFRLDGTFVRKFGSPGSEEGQLNRPAGVAVDYYGRIVITDKDNHRVQIFTMEGDFVFAFGERGQANGKFHYPWDVAVNSHGIIVVSDTRNHRVQMFTGNGVFLKKFGFESMSNMWKYFDSPRGVCFTSPNTVIVTDFNNHRLYEMDIEKTPKIINPDAYKKCELFRPQGVAVDEDGNILVADCRNNRIQVFNKQGENIGQFGVAGKEPGQFDRPSGIALTNDGKIIVVDFGNHRIQIF